jgi:hypothetical protein
LPSNAGLAKLSLIPPSTQEEPSALGTTQDKLTNVLIAVEKSLSKARTQLVRSLPIRAHIVAPDPLTCVPNTANTRKIDIDHYLALNLISADMSAGPASQRSLNSWLFFYDRFSQGKRRQCRSRLSATLELSRLDLHCEKGV